MPPHLAVIGDTTMIRADDTWPLWMVVALMWMLGVALVSAGSRADPRVASNLSPHGAAAARR